MKFLIFILLTQLCLIRHSFGLTFEKSDIKLSAEPVLNIYKSTATFETNEFTTGEWKLTLSDLKLRQEELSIFGLEKIEILSEYNEKGHLIYLLHHQGSFFDSYDLETQIKSGNKIQSIVWTFDRLLDAQKSLNDFKKIILVLQNNRIPANDVGCELQLFDKQIINAFNSVNSALEATCAKTKLQQNKINELDIIKSCAEGIASSPVALAEFFYDLTSTLFKLNFNSEYRRKVQGSVQSLMAQIWSHPREFAQGLYQSISKMLISELKKIQRCGPAYQAQIICRTVTDLISGGLLLKGLKKSSAVLRTEKISLKEVSNTVAKEQLESSAVKVDQLSIEIAELMKSNPQMAIWKLKESGRLIEAKELESKIVHTLENEEIVKTEHIGIGVTGAKLITFKDGTQAIWKTAGSSANKDWAKHEVAAYEVDQKLGLNMVPVTTERKLGDVHGSIQLVVGQLDKAKYVDRPEYYSFFDKLISNDDRHPGNILTVNGRAVAIDHGFSFVSNDVRSFDVNVGDVTHKMRFVETTKEKQVLSDQLKYVLPPKESYEKLKNISESEWRSSLSGKLTENEMDQFLKNRQGVIDKVEPIYKEYGDRIFPDGQQSPLLRSKQEEVMRHSTDFPF